VEVVIDADATVKVTLGEVTAAAFDALVGVAT